MSDVMEQTATGRDLPVQPGVGVHYKIGGRGKTGYGIVEAVYDANVRLMDYGHYNKSLLVQRHNLIRILTSDETEQIKNKPKTSKDTDVLAASESNSETEKKPACSTPNRNTEYVHEPKTYDQPPPPKGWTGPKITKKVAGVDVTLCGGHQYGLSIPGNFVGPVKVFLVVNDKRGPDIALIDMHPNLYKQFGNDFPSYLIWK